MTCDVSVAKEREALLRWAIDTAAGLNILVNNAGIQRDIDFMQGIAEYEAGPSEIAINLEALVVLSALFIPHLAKQKNPAIVNVSSGLGFVPAARMPVYSATKAAVHAFSMALRHQLKAVGIEIYEVVPPAVDTELNTEGRAKRGGFRAGLGADEFVAAVMKGMASGRVEIGYGTTERSIKASREELDESFERMNGRW